MELVMAGSITTDNTQMDALTSRAVAKGIGEKLQRTLGTQQPYPDRLQKLLEKMRDQEAREASAISGAGGGNIIT